MDVIRRIDAAIMDDDVGLIPNDSDLVAQSYLLAEMDENDLLGRFVNYDYSQGRIQARTNDTSPASIQAITAGIEEAVERARLLYRGSGFDISLVGFSGWESIPHVTMTPQGPAAGYRRVTTIGAGLASAIGDIGVWAEGRHSAYEDDYEQSEVVIGADYSLANGVYLLGEIRSLIDDTDASYTVMAAVEGTFSSIHSWSVGIMADPDEKSAVVRPELDVSLADGLSLIVGGSFAVGDHPVSGPMAAGDHVRVALQAAFNGTLRGARAEDLLAREGPRLFREL